MDPIQFDRLSKRFARRHTRRQALATGTGLAATGLLASRRTSAQDATPAATPAPFPSDPHPGADSATTHPEFLFTQSFDAGTWAPKPGEEGTYLLTLTGAAAQTVYFSDRPERVVGLAPMQAFLDGLGFTPDNPPNAALVTQTERGESDILVIELFDPVYDAAAGTLTYEAKVLADYGERGLAYLAQQQTDYELAESFGPGSLFIDDCLDSTDDGCWVMDGNNYDYLGEISSGNCWNHDGPGCQPCGSYSGTCNATYSRCQGNCSDDIALCGYPGCYGGTA